MPRRNNTPKHARYTPPATGHTKRRFNTEREAQKAADDRMAENMSLELSVYKDIDGGWYLTSRQSHSHDQ